MSDNIFGERFYGTRKPAWHMIGQVFQKALKPSVAVKKIGMDYTVDKYPMVALVDKQQIDTGKICIMRSPTADDPVYQVFGFAGGKYEITQNVDLARIMNPLAEVWPLETMGAINNGKTVFMTFNTGGVEIEGDPINGYFMLVDVKDGGTSTKLVYTPVRVVCQNTLISGLRQATVSISIQHTPGAQAQLEARVNLIAKAREAIDETTAVFRKLATARITPNQAELMFDNVYPLPRLPEDAALENYSVEDLGALLFKGVKDSMYDYNYYTERAKTLRAGAMTLYEKLNDEYPALASTPWHAYNAVVESADFRDGGKAPEFSALFGPRAKEKKDAFEYAVALTGKKR